MPDNASSTTSRTLLLILLGLLGLAAIVSGALLIDERSNSLQTSFSILLIVGGIALMFGAMALFFVPPTPQQSPAYTTTGSRWRRFSRNQNQSSAGSDVIIVEQEGRGVLFIVALFVALIIFLIVGFAFFMDRAIPNFEGGNLRVGCSGAADDGCVIMSSDTFNNILDMPKATAVPTIPALPLTLQPGTTHAALPAYEIARWEFITQPQQRFDIIIYPMGKETQKHDLELRVLDSSGNVHEMAVYAGPGKAELLHGSAPNVAAHFTVEVWNQSGSASPYGLIYLPDSHIPLAEQRLMPHTPAQGRMNAGEIQYWFIEGHANQMITITTQPIGRNGRFLDLALSLHDATSQPVSPVAQKPGMAKHMTQKYHLPRSGTYTLWVENRNPVDSEYVVTLR